MYDFFHTKVTVKPFKNRFWTGKLILMPVHSAKENRNKIAVLVEKNTIFWAQSFSLLVGLSSNETQIDDIFIFIYIKNDCFFYFVKK